MVKSSILKAIVLALSFFYQTILAQSSVDYQTFRNTLRERSIDENRDLLAQWIDETPSLDSLQRVFIDIRLSELRNEPDFWNPIRRKLQDQYVSTIPDVENKLLSFMLWEWGAEDQKFRSLIKFYEVETPAFGTAEFKTYQKELRKENKQRAEMVLALLKQYDTWLTTELVGKHAEYSSFFIIQHAENSARKKALPFLKKAIDEGKSSPKYYTLMYDRYLLMRGKPQIYGTQLIKTDAKYRLDKHISVSSMNENRKEIGLGTVQEYVLDGFGEKVYEMVFGE